MDSKSIDASNENLPLDIQSCQIKYLSDYFFDQIKGILKFR